MSPALRDAGGAAILEKMPHAVLATLWLAALAFAEKPAGGKPAAAPAKSSAPVSDASALSGLLERAGRAAGARDRKTFLDCLTLTSRKLFAKVFPGETWEPADLAGRKDLRVLEVKRHGERPWAMLAIPAKSGDGRDALFARKEGGRWVLDQQHPLLLWDTVQSIMRSQKGEKRARAELEAPTLLPRKLASSNLPEGWSADDPAAEDDWRHLPGVKEAFLQRLSGPREKNVKAKFVLFNSAEDAEWELWRRGMEFGLRSDLHDRQPALGDGAAYGRHSNINYELLVRKGSTLVILYANSEDVVPIGQRVVDRF